MEGYACWRKMYYTNEPGERPEERVIVVGNAGTRQLYNTLMQRQEVFGDLVNRNRELLQTIETDITLFIAQGGIAFRSGGIVVCGDVHDRLPRKLKERLDETGNAQDFQGALAPYFPELAAYPDRSMRQLFVLAKDFQQGIGYYLTIGGHPTFFYDAPNGTRLRLARFILWANQYVKQAFSSEKTDLLVSAPTFVNQLFFDIAQKQGTGEHDHSERKTRGFHIEL